MGGRGVRCGLLDERFGVSTVHLTFNEDGSVNLIEGSTDIGGTRRRWRRSSPRSSALRCTR